MSENPLLLLPIFLSLGVAALVLPFLRKKPGAGAWAVFGTVLVSFLAVMNLLPGADTFVLVPWVGPFEMHLELNPFRALLLLFIFLFQLLNGLYLVKFIERVRRPWLFLSFALVAFASAYVVVLTRNVLVLLIAWEMFLAALYSTILSGGEAAEPVAYKALLIGGASDFLMILGLMLYMNLDGALAMFGNPIPIHGNGTAFAAFFLIFLGAGAKAGMWPFQTWIPEAAEVMPAPGFAALPASLEKILGIYFLFMLCNHMFVLSPLAKGVMFVFALVTVFAAIIPALVEQNLKKVLAYTAISPVGFMVAGMATSHAAGLVGALMYMLTHATYKSGMFYAAGNFEALAGETLESIERRKVRMPLTVAGFLLGGLAAISFWPTGGFMAKEFILEGVGHQHQYLVLVLLVLGAALNVAVFAKLAAVLLSGWRTKESGDAPGFQALPVLVLGLLALVGGLLFIAFAGTFVQALSFGTTPGTTDVAWIQHALLHISPLTVVSLAVWILGAALFLALRPAEGPAATTFEFLRTSPVLGRAFQLADEKKLDAYEVALKVVQWLSRLVFVYVERLIDTIADWLIQAGRGITKPALSAIHNGVYSNYLAWVIAGFALVAGLVLLR